jgi:lipid II:glycine glycyltransferase (peptidoglycan interpeptide bridge formation enzyme)
MVFHTYIIAGNRARLAQSVSLFRMSDDGSFRNLTGRANRLLHWEDMLYFKRLGYSIYDFGGVNPDTANEETNAITRFKECFGGRRVVEYNSTAPASLKGLLYAAYRKLLSFTAN